MLGRMSENGIEIWTDPESLLTFGELSRCVSFVSLESLQNGPPAIPCRNVSPGTNDTSKVKNPALYLAAKQVCAGQPPGGAASRPRRWPPTSIHQS